MTTTVVTRSVCDRCKCVCERVGAEGGVPPVGWASFSLYFRAKGDGWAGGGRARHAQLCPNCAAVVEAALYYVASGYEPKEMHFPI